MQREVVSRSIDSILHYGRLQLTLSTVQLHGFSRLQWYLECNLLACRMQVWCVLEAEYYLLLVFS